MIKIASDGSRYVVETDDGKLYIADKKWMEISLGRIYDQMKASGTLPVGVKSPRNAKFLVKAGEIWQIGHFERSLLTSARYYGGDLVPIYPTVDVIDPSKILYVHHFTLGVDVISIVMEDGKFACFRKTDESRTEFYRNWKKLLEKAENLISDEEWIFNPQFVTSYREGEPCLLTFHNGYELKVRFVTAAVEDLIVSLLKRQSSAVEFAAVMGSREGSEIWQVARIYEWYPVVEGQKPEPKYYEVVSKYDEYWEDIDLAETAAEMLTRKMRGDHLTLEEEVMWQLEEYFLHNNGSTAELAAFDAEVLKRRSRGKIYLAITSASWVESDSISEEKGVYTLTIPSSSECAYRLDGKNPWREALREQLKKFFE